MTMNLNGDRYLQQVGMQADPVNLAESPAVAVASVNDSYYDESGPPQQNGWEHLQDQQGISGNSVFERYFGPPRPQLPPMPDDGHGWHFQRSRSSNDMPGGYYDPPELQSPTISYDEGDRQGVNDLHIQCLPSPDPTLDWIISLFPSEEGALELSNSNLSANSVLATGGGPALSIQPLNPYGSPESGLRSSSPHNIILANAFPDLHQISTTDEGKKESMSKASVAGSTLLSPTVMTPFHVSATGVPHACRDGGFEPPLEKGPHGFAKPIKMWERLMDKSSSKVQTEEMDRLFFPEDQKHGHNEQGYYICQLKANIPRQGQAEWLIGRHACRKELKTTDAYRRHLQEIHLGVGRTKPHKNMRERIARRMAMAITTEDLTNNCSVIVDDVENEIEEVELTGTRMENSYEQTIFRKFQVQEYVNY